MWHSHLNDMEIPETKRFIPKGFEIGYNIELANNIRSISSRKLTFGELSLCRSSDKGLMLKTSASLSVHSRNLTLNNNIIFSNLFDSKFYC